MRLFAIAAVLLLTACANTVPASYQAQSFVNVGSGAVAMGDFLYIPYKRGKVKSNQIQNTAVGSIYIATDVAAFVKRATALELERGGLTVDDGAGYRIEAAVLEFKAADLGFSVDWSYRIHYQAIDVKTGRPVVDQQYTSKPVRTSKFGRPADYIPLLNGMVLDALEQFMQDLRVTDRFS